MGYELSVMTQQDCNQVLSDVDEAKRRLLKSRGGYFENNPNCAWVIDRASGSYLFYAPKLDPMDIGHSYYFVFDGVCYCIYIKSIAKGIAKIDQLDDVSAEEKRRVVKNAVDALYVHGAFGYDGDAPLKVVFEGVF